MYAGLTHWQSSNFFAYYPCNSSFPAMLGEMLCAGFATQNFSWIGSPAATELETVSYLYYALCSLRLTSCMRPDNSGGLRSASCICKPIHCALSTALGNLTLYSALCAPHFAAPEGGTPYVLSFKQNFHGWQSQTMCKMHVNVKSHAAACCSADPLTVWHR